MNARILIVHPEGNISNNPNLAGIVEVLCERGFEVHVFSRLYADVPQQFVRTGCEFQIFRVNEKSVPDFTVVLPPELLSNMTQLRRFVQDNFKKYDLVIGVDRGIIEAALIAAIQKVPCGLISYEIFFAIDTGANFKQLEISACERISFAVCQDAERSHHLARENQIPLEKIINVPVAGRKACKGRRSYYLHDALRIDRQKQLALYIGESTSNWAGFDELIDSTTSWDESWVLVLHQRYGKYNSERMDRLARLKRKNVAISPFGPLPLGEIHKLLHSADLGVAFYLPQMDSLHPTEKHNLKYIGLSSGKIATYLQHGLPLLINQIGEYSRLCINHNLGFVVDSFSRLPETLYGISNSLLAEFRRNCIRFFSERLDLDRTIEPMLSKIGELLGTSGPKVEKAYTSNGGWSNGPSFLSENRPLRAMEDRSSPRNHITKRDRIAGRFLVSAIVSAYNSEKYFKACIENLVQQTLYRQGRMEIIIINSGSQQGEDPIARKFAENNADIVYLRTERETLYAAWNRGIEIARGKYVVNANTDDTLREDALDLLTASLETCGSADLAYCDCAWTRVPNDRFSDSHAFRIVNYPPFNPALGIFCCLLGPHPVWRRSLFARIGLFNPSYSAAGDFEFQMRFIQAGCTAVHVPEVLSLFFQNQDGLTLSSQRSRDEVVLIENRFRPSMPIERLYALDGSAPAAAAAWVFQGNLALDWKCPWLDNTPPLYEYAEFCFSSALESDPDNQTALRNLCALLARRGKWENCLELLARKNCRDADLVSRIRDRKLPALILCGARQAVETPIQPMVSQGGKNRTPRCDDPMTSAEISVSPNGLHVLYDISVLGLGAIYESARTGIYRVVEHLLEGLVRVPGIKLSLCATQASSEISPETITGCRKYLTEHAAFREIPFYESRLPQADIFHSPFHRLPSEADAPARFLTIHDLIPTLYPQFVPARVCHLQRAALAQCKPHDRFLCTSHSTKRDLIRMTGFMPERATVTPLAADPELFYPNSDEGKLAEIRARYGIGEGAYILSLCTLEPRKNIDHVIRAYARWVREGQAGNVRLVLVGTRGWDYQRIFDEIGRDPALRSRVILTGYVDDRDLAALYSGATVFVYMSFYEGFGLPPLEAMQCGTPVIASDNSSLPEVVEDAGILLDPRDLDGLCLAMNEVAVHKELREEMSRRATRQAAKFSWTRCVAQTVAAYHAACESPCGVRKAIAHHDA